MFDKMDGDQIAAVIVLALFLLIVPPCITVSVAYDSYLNHKTQCLEVED